MSTSIRSCSLGALSSWALVASLHASPAHFQVQCLAPNGGEVYLPGEPVIVEWQTNADGPGVSVDLHVSHDNGVGFECIASGLGDTSTFEWVPTDRPTRLAIFRVEARDGEGRVAVDESDAVFGVGPEPETGQGTGAGVAATPLPTTILDFQLPGTQPGMVQDLQSGLVCTPCHGKEFEATTADIFPDWQGTMMANASIDPLFEACLAIAEQDAPGSGDLCLRCHIPKAWLAGRSSPTDGSAVLDSDRTGLSCDFCHRMVNPIYDEDPAQHSPVEDLPILAGLVTPAKSFQPPGYGNGMYVVEPEGFVLDWEAPIRGPRKGAVSPGHDVIVSPFHKQGDFCGTCHDVSNPAYIRLGNGKYTPNSFAKPPLSVSASSLMPIERTYSEWKNSGAADTCQDCHMRAETGKACILAVPHADTASHDLTGGNTWVPQLLKVLHPGKVNPDSLDATIARAGATLGRAAALKGEQVGSKLKVTVFNKTGHKLPTGYPEGRRMWLTVKFLDKELQPFKVSGDYDYGTGVLKKDPELKVYEAEMGIDSAVSSLTGIPAGKTFHFVLNNVVLKDNRIPPHGFTNESFRSFNGEPVGHQYEDGQYWDDTFYDIPVGAAGANVFLNYQTASKEYIEFLRDKNVTNDKGDVLYNLWQQNKSPPVVMTYIHVELTGTTLYVDQSATGAGTGSSWEDAFDTLQGALFAARQNLSFNKISVAAGKYELQSRAPLDPEITFRVRNGMTLEGGHGKGKDGQMEHDPGQHETILSGEGKFYHVVTVDGGPESLAAVLADLTITGGNASARAGQGGGLLVNGGHVIARGCRFVSNAAESRGGAISVVNAGKLELGQCEIRDNDAFQGGGLYFAGSRLYGLATSFHSNEARSAGGAAYVQATAATPSLESCAITGNKAPDGAGLFLDAGMLTLTNCSLSANSATGEGGGVHVAATELRPPELVVYNSILWGNTDKRRGDAAAQIHAAPAQVAVQYSCVGDASPGDADVFPGPGNFDLNPMMLDAQAGKVALKSDSPCIDAGDSDRNVAADLFGRSRRVDDPATPDTGHGVKPLPDMGAAEFVRILYADAGVESEVADGTTWHTAFRELRDALDLALEADSQVEEVWVAAGRYRPAPPTSAPDRTASFRLRSGLAIYGGFQGGEEDRDDRNPGGNRAFLSGDILGDDDKPGVAQPLIDNSYHVVAAIGTNATAVLDGFTIERGHAKPQSMEGGGGIFVSEGSPRFEACIVEKNSSPAEGGGAFVVGGGAPVFSRSIFRSNEAQAGGGLYVQGGDPVVSACRIGQNTATSAGGGGILLLEVSTAQIINSSLGLNSGSFGGGLRFTGGTLDVINSSFGANHAVIAGGGISGSSGSLRVRNSVLWGNTDAGSNLTAAQIAGAASVAHSCIQGGWAGSGPEEVGNILTDPKFAFPNSGLLSLSLTSPCIDAGDNTAVPPTVTTDLYDSSRFEDRPNIPDTGNGPPPIVDMGAVEVPPPVPLDFGDADGNGQVDSDDVTAFWFSMTGPENTAGRKERAVFDADRDQDIDMLDFLELQRRLLPARPRPTPPKLHVRVTSESRARIEVPPGAPLLYEVRGVLGDTANGGLAAVIFDLGFSGGPLESAEHPRGGATEAFLPPAGMTNPAGFGGTPLGGALIQVGGAQNTVGGTGRETPYPGGAVSTRVAHAEAVLATGFLEAPGREGVYILSLHNLAGSVLVSEAGGRGAGLGSVRSVEELTGGDVADLTIVVTAASGGGFRRADANTDGRVDISDAAAVLGYLFLGNPQLRCLDAGDINDSGRLDLSDAVYLLNHLFTGGQSPPAPFPGCGSDPTDDGLSCESYERC